MGAGGSEEKISIKIKMKAGKSFVFFPAPTIRGEYYGFDVFDLNQADEFLSIKNSSDLFALLIKILNVYNYADYGIWLDEDCEMGEKLLEMEPDLTSDRLYQLKILKDKYFDYESNEIEKGDYSSYKKKRLKNSLNKQKDQWKNGISFAYDRLKAIFDEIEMKGGIENISYVECEHSCYNYGGFGQEEGWIAQSELKLPKVKSKAGKGRKFYLDIGNEKKRDTYKKVVECFDGRLVKNIGELWDIEENYENWNIDYYVYDDDRFVLTEGFAEILEKKEIEVVKLSEFMNKFIGDSNTNFYNTYYVLYEMNDFDYYENIKRAKYEFRKKKFTISTEHHFDGIEIEIDPEIKVFS